MNNVASRFSNQSSRTFETICILTDMWWWLRAQVLKNLCKNTINMRRRVAKEIGKVYNGFDVQKINEDAK